MADGTCTYLGTISSSIKIEASYGYLSITSGAHKAGAFRRELCSGIDGEGGVTAKGDQVAFHWGTAVK